MLRRAIRRQKAIRESRDLAWILFIIMLSIAYVGVAGILRSVSVAGTALTAGGIVSAIFVAVAGWVAAHLVREAIRLGRLMKDSNRIMSVDDTSDLASGVQWAKMNPFGQRRS